MAERDLLICGTCSSQFSDLKLFIDHKETCGHTPAALPITNNGVTPTTQQVSNIGSQQFIIPPQGHASIVSFPIGVPHIILQTSSGAPQMYKLVLEPSVNSHSQVSSFQVQTSQSTHIYNSFNHLSSASATSSISNSPGDKLATSKDLQKSLKLDFDSKGICVEEQPFPVNEPNVTRVGSVNSIETSWSTQRCDGHAEGFDSIPTNDLSEKAILDHTAPSHSSSNLHTEEEVATFLATQLVSQNSVAQSPKKENFSTAKQNQISDQTNSCLTMVEPMYGKDKESPKFDSKLHSKAQMSPQKTPARNCELTKEAAEKESKKKHCSYENCDFATQHMKDLVRHIRKHTGEKPFQCPICGLRLSRQDKLKIHQRIHSKERPYVCTEPGCSYRGNEKAHLKKHRRTHTNERPFSCQFCPYTAKDASHLTVHLRSHTGDTPFHCQVEGCAAAFKTSSDLKRHETLHTGEKPFKCQECSYTSALKANLRVHITNNHSKQGKHSCKSCQFLCSTKKQLKEHEKTHLPSIGSVMTYDSGEDKSFLTEYNDSTNKQVSYPDIAMKKLMLNKGRRRVKPFCPKNFKCETCGSGFVREDSLRSHMRQHESKSKSKDQQIIQADMMREQVKRERIKTQYPLNYILQGNAGGVLRECLVAPKEEESLVKEQSQVSSREIMQRNEQITETPSAEGNETFSTYMIAIAKPLDTGIPFI